MSDKQNSIAAEQPAIVDKCDADALDNDLFVSSLNVMPPKRTYTARVRYHFVGRGRPLPYDFDHVFDEET